MEFQFNHSVTITPDPELVAEDVVDNGAADFDSAIGSQSAGDDVSAFTSTTSMADSMRQSRNKYGRIYQQSATTTYWGPADEQQTEALDITNHWMRILFLDKLAMAPIDNPQTALDIGTGTGCWAIEFADENPQCTVTGTDIAPIQPSWVPPNCHFHIDDAQLDWAFATNYFDYVHIRHMTGCIDNWRKLYSQSLLHMRPGGYLEHVEYDIQMRSNSIPGGELPPDHIFPRWYNNFVEAGRQTGRSFEYPVLDRGMPKLMEEIGFEDVTHRTWKVPIGSWAADRNLKELGLFTLDFLDNSLEGFALLLFKDVLRIADEEFDRMLGEMRAAWADQKRLQPYFVLHMAYGRKPMAA